MRLTQPLAAVVIALSFGGCASPPPATQAKAPVPSTSSPSKPTLTADEVAAVTADKVVISFPDGSSTLTPAANAQLDLAARLFRDASPVVMFTSGHSDPSGDEYTNLLLSARRAAVVKQGLVARGIPANKLLLQALGQSEPVDKSDPLSSENRRVVITWRLS
jgi:outer membrane protein OmpA-like peptidoglycan-associated protein